MDWLWLGIVDIRFTQNSSDSHVVTFRVVNILTRLMYGVTGAIRSMCVESDAFLHVIVDTNVKNHFSWRYRRLHMRDHAFGTIRIP
jgi:hypothetical protein